MGSASVEVLQKGEKIPNGAPPKGTHPENWGNLSTGAHHPGDVGRAGGVVAAC